MKIFSRKWFAEQIEEAEEALPTVPVERKVSLAYRNMREIPRPLVDGVGKWVEILDLSYNKLRDLCFLKSMKNLHTLNLDHNLVVSTTVFPDLPRLKVLWLNFNLISNLKVFVPMLSCSCPNLEVISLMGNMAAPNFINGGTPEEEREYRSFVISHFHHLNHLDDKSVTNSERQSCPAPPRDDAVTNLIRRLKATYAVAISRPNSIV